MYSHFDTDDKILEDKADKFHFQLVDIQAGINLQLIQKKSKAGQLFWGYFMQIRELCTFYIFIFCVVVS